jgi:hypothetical protein
MRRPLVITAALSVVLAASLPAQARETPQLRGDVVFDVTPWNVPVPAGAVSARELGFEVLTTPAARRGYAVCRVASASAVGGVVSRVGVSCAADRSQTLTVSLVRGQLSATQSLAYTLGPPVGRASDFRVARFEGRRMRWRPCLPVPVRFNPGPAPRPAFVESGFRYALRQVRQASGIPLRYRGLTSFVPKAGRQVPAEGIVVAYVGAGRGSKRSNFPQLQPERVLGIGGWRSDPAGRWLQAGYAVVKRTAATRDETTYVVTMMHEIGHAIGLDHASVRGRQVMAPAESAPGIVWGLGDLTGLRKAGPGGAC